MNYPHQKNSQYFNLLIVYYSYQYFCYQYKNILILPFNKFFLSISFFVYSCAHGFLFE